MYKLKRVKVKGVSGKGKYVRTEKDRAIVSARMAGNVWPAIRFTDHDKDLQRREMKKVVRCTQKDILAGSIPKLSDMMAYARGELEKTADYQVIKNDNARLQKMIAAQSLAVADYAMKLYEGLPSEDKTAKKFYSYFVKGYKDIIEQARKAIDSANEIEHGRKLTVEKKGKFEDALEKLEVIDAEGHEVKDDTGGTKEPN